MTDKSISRIFIIHYFKVVGGMTWCITTCDFDVDVDLLFQENSTIGQKMYIFINIFKGTLKFIALQD